MSYRKLPNPFDHLKNEDGEIVFCPRMVTNGVKVIKSAISRSGHFKIQYCKERPSNVHIYAMSRNAGVNFWVRLTTIHGDYAMELALDHFNETQLLEILEEKFLRNCPQPVYTKIYEEL